MKPVTGWHFAGETLRDGRPLPKKGETLVHDGEVIACECGYHLSKEPIDALAYAPGFMVAQVRGSGKIVEHGNPVDKYACQKRTNLSGYVDASAVIVELARVWALRAARVRAANALDKAGLAEHADALRSLPVGASSDNIGDAARAAALAAARAAARAARDAARAAARAAWDAAGAARAARAAAWAAWDAAGAARAARDAAWAAWDAAGDARVKERALQNKELKAALHKLIKEHNERA